MASPSNPRRLIAQSSLGRRDFIGRIPAVFENDDHLNSDSWVEAPTLSRPPLSEKALQHHLNESAVGSMDDHLVEFSDALRTVARALRAVSDGKARALEEAEEWKRKYELERLRNLTLSSSNPTLSQGSVVPVENGKAKASMEIYTHSQESLQTKEPNAGMKTSDANPKSGKAIFALSWGSCGEKSRYHQHDVVSFESGNIITAGRTSKQIILEWETHPRSVAILTKPNSNPVQVLCKEMVRWLKEKDIVIYVEPRVKQELETEGSYFSFVQTWETGNRPRDEEVLQLHKDVDLVITLGGDGTVLWAASLFKGPVPPVVSFAMGSLGFMTPFQSEQYKECLQSAMKGPMHITLRHRLKCRIIQAPENEGELDSPRISSEEFFLVLNEVSIDRGISPFLTYLECYCDNFFVTCVQGDGLILSTTSGSTAYSLAAGGSMVDPQVPGILFTPICPHSLSFRPLILPEHVTIRVQIPLNSRGQAWASFDGKDRRQLRPGDALVCCMSQWPVPTASHGESTHNFLTSVREGLHWNLRKIQSSDGPRDASI